MDADKISFAIAQKGAGYFVFCIISLAMVMVAGVYLSWLVWDGYWREGTYGGSLFTIVPLYVFFVWHLLKNLRMIFFDDTLIRVEDSRLKYGVETAVELSAVHSFVIVDGLFRKLILKDGAGHQIKSFPLFLSSTANIVVRDRLLSVISSTSSNT